MARKAVALASLGRLGLFQQFRCNPRRPVPTRHLVETLKALKARPVLGLDILRAIAELALANWQLRKAGARDLLTASGGKDGPEIEPTEAQQRMAGRVAYVVPRVGRRVPWRSDCLVQALAARHWLAGRGIATSLRIGTRKTGEKGFEAHAWLIVADIVVTGWDIDGFDQFAAFPPFGNDGPDTV
jgi:hypothetical protein